MENREQEIECKFLSSKAKRKESKPSHSDLTVGDRGLEPLVKPPSDREG